MISNPGFPFERNRYYSGKMLTSADFAAEQAYINNKRNFMNHLVYGSGIVCGCNVCGIDDFTVLIESGLAIDTKGREVVIDSSVIKKLTAISGFEETKSNRVALYLKYKEEMVQPVSSVQKPSGENTVEYNRIREGYEIFLKDAELCESVTQSEGEFLTGETIYQDEDYKIEFRLPAVVCKNKRVKIQLKIEKISAANHTCSFEGCLQMPAFLTEEGKHELYIEVPETTVEEGQTVTREYWVLVQDGMSEDAAVFLKNGLVKIGEETKETKTDCTIKVNLADVEPEVLVNHELGKTCLEKKEKQEQEDSVCLAEIEILRTEEVCSIKKIEERTVKKYVEVPANRNLRKQYLNYFKDTKSAAVAVKTEYPWMGNAGKYFGQEPRMQIATGVIEIPVGGKAKPGEVFYSGEVMHGLGTGAVYVEIGQELMEEDSVKGANTKSTIYGNSKLFAQPGELIPKTEKAVKVLNDKGSFIAAISFTEETECLMLSYRWVAVKFAHSDKTKLEENTETQWIEAETPTVVLGTKESYYFGVNFHDMDKCGITYQITEEDGGEITMDGVYTAPNREGVFEIMISCIERPYISTYAYAIVKKK